MLLSSLKSHTPCVSLFEIYYLGNFLIPSQEKMPSNGIKKNYIVLHQGYYSIPCHTKGPSHTIRRAVPSQVKSVSVQLHLALVFSQPLVFCSFSLGLMISLFDGSVDASAKNLSNLHILSRLPALP